MQTDEDPWSLRMEGNALRSGGLRLKLLHQSVVFYKVLRIVRALVSIEGEAMLAAQSKNLLLLCEGGLRRSDGQGSTMFLSQVNVCFDQKRGQLAVVCYL